MAVNWLATSGPRRPGPDQGGCLTISVQFPAMGKVSGVSTRACRVGTRADARCFRKASSMTDEPSMQEESRSNSPNTIAAPAPTAWPMVLAAAITMVFAGLVTNGYLSMVGGVVIVFAAVGWWREVLPFEHEHEVALERAPDAIRHATSRRVERLRLGQEGHRVRIPAEIKPYSSG